MERKGNQILAISVYGLDGLEYDEWDENEDIENNAPTWETCALRSWLNGKFLNAAFSASERAMIPNVTVAADVNPNIPTSSGNDTQDQVFLLSITEAEQYFSTDADRQCVPTDYAKAQGCYVDDSGCCWWWLWSPGEGQSRAANVIHNGDVYNFGDLVYSNNVAVRPALWIDLDD